MPAGEDMSTIEPPRLNFEPAARQNRNAATAFSSSRFRTESESVFVAGISRPVPALITSMSTTPKNSFVRSKDISAADSFVTSKVMVSQCPPSALIDAAIDSSRSDLLATRHTRLPSVAKSRAVASPIPEEAPTTSTALSARPRQWISGFCVIFPNRVLDSQPEKA
jgi:hypothetical protein